MGDDSQVRLVAVGDVMLGDSSHFLGRGVGSRISRSGPEYPWVHVLPVLSGCDVFFANLESPVSSRPGSDSWTRVYRAKPEVLPGLKVASTNVVSLANNHILEHGREVLSETRDLLTRNRILFAGFSPSGGPGDVCRWRQGGLDFSLFAVSLVRDLAHGEISAQEIEDWLIGGLADEGTADVKIVSLHWGDEYVTCPSPEQVRLGRKLVASGATLVLGHHPHVLQPVERIGRGLIAYSLGNFIFDQDWSPATRRGGILEVLIGKEGVRDWRFVPTLLDSRCQPRIAGEVVSRRVMKAIWRRVDGQGKGYSARRVSAQKWHRLLMKLELVRNLPAVSWDTIHFLFTKRRRPKSDIA